MNFKEKVYKICKKIPKGKVLSYKEVAKLAGSSCAWRTVGSILNKNSNSKIPCHRVIKSDGKVGGYKDGIKKKISLLKREGLKIKGKKIVF